jgi:hypothetical protein
MRKLACLVLALSACSQETSREDKIAMLESIKREQIAAVVRQQGECTAVAVEFKNDPAMNANCAETLRFITETSGKVIADIDRRIAEIR